MTDRIHQALQSLQSSKFRSSFKLSEKDLTYINTRGVDLIRNHAFDFISSRIAPQFHRNDGKQTPMKNHPVFIAQHATATCCRSCIQKWHHIYKGKALTGDEIQYIVDLIMEWIQYQIPVSLKGTEDAVRLKGGFFSTVER